MQHLQQGNLGDAEALCRQLLDNNGKDDPESWLTMAAIQAGLGNIEEVKQCCLKAISLDPNSAIACFNLAISQQSLGDLDSAVASYRRAIELQPSHAGAHANLGAILREQHKTADAVSHLHTAASLQPGNPDLFYSLGNACRELGDIENATQHLRTALRLSPGDPKVLNDLGSLLLLAGEATEAVDCFYRYLATNPDSFTANYNLSIALWQLNRHGEALSHCCRAIRITPESLSARQSLSQLLGLVPGDSLPPDIWQEVEKTFYFDGVDTQQLINPAIAYIKKNKLFRELDKASRTSEPEGLEKELSGQHYLPLLGDGLLLAAMTFTLITDYEFESLLTLARRTFLNLATNRMLPEPDPACISFLSALANQCFLTGYAYYTTPEEEEKLGRLHELIGTFRHDFPKPDDELTLLLMVLASYEPLGLSELPMVAKYTGLSALPDRVKEVIKRQITEPEEERKLAEHIQSLTGISDRTSRAVQDQYEDSPYPRWINVTHNNPRPYFEVLGSIFPNIEPLNIEGNTLELLIAGCGTGKHALLSATRFKDSHITAIDLSKTSLAYAKRKTSEYGIGNIDYYQADIIELGKLDRTFHIIESIGVLHHLENPARGLDALLDLLLPGGLLLLGLYSTCARRHITQAREFVRENGLQPNNRDMRIARREIARLDNNNPLRNIMHMNDFYALSDLRDLVFHVQEHTYTIPQIEELITRADLRFIGFEFTDPAVLLQYKHIYPDDPSCTNLANWHSYEQNHKDTFIGMYTFWCQKQ
jgi:tetratricopeptide (TPR) repeat protein